MKTLARCIRILLNRKKLYIELFDGKPNSISYRLEHFFKINGMFLPSQRIVTALFLVSSIPEEGSKPHINPPLYISQNVNLTQWFYKRGKNCETFTDEGTDRRRNRHIYRGMECRWSEKFTWTFGLDELKSAHIIHEAIGHFQTSFEKDKQLFLHYKLTQRFTQFKYLHVTFWILITSM